MKSAKILQTNAKITNGNEIFEAIPKLILSDWPTFILTVLKSEILWKGCFKSEA